MRSSRAAILATAILAGSTMAQKLATIEGKVTNSVTGEPIPRAHVALRQNNGESLKNYGALTDADGKFRIINVQAGEFVLDAERVGFIRNSGSTLKVADGDSRAEQNLKLVPTGAITGRVLTPEGEPVEGVQVYAMGGESSQVEGSTDDEGRFRIAGLFPGRYRVLAQPTDLQVPQEVRSDGTTEIHYSRTYYPSVAGEKTAPRVAVRARR
jgi:hypothetical protein